MEKLGIVEKIEDNMAYIKILRDSACGDNCAACGLCSNREMMIKLPSSEGLCEGDNVKLLSDDSAFIKKSILAYLSLTILLVLGGVVGTLTGNEWLSFFLALIFAAAGVFVIRKFLPKGIEIRIQK